MFKKATLYVVRTDKTGNYLNSAPCRDCFKIIKELSIKKIIYSTNDNKFEMYKSEDYETNHISNGNRFLKLSNGNKNR